MREYLGNAWAIFRGEKSYKVELLFELDAAKLVTETLWHYTQREIRALNGDVTLTFAIDGLDEIVHWLFRWAGRVKVIRPTELRDAYVHAMSEAIELNGHAKD